MHVRMYARAQRRAVARRCSALVIPPVMPLRLRVVFCPRSRSVPYLFCQFSCSAINRLFQERQGVHCAIAKLIMAPDM